MRATKPMLSSRASFSSRPQAVSMPAARSRASPLPGDQRVGIAHRRHDAGNPGGDQRRRAGRRAAMVAARFQRHVGGGAARPLAGGAQAWTSACGSPAFLVPALADDLAVAHQHATDPRVGRGRPQAALGQLQGARHHAVVDGREGHFVSGAGETSRMAREKASTSSKLRYTEAKRM
jgi:hypothetical protein